MANVLAFKIVLTLTEGVIFGVLALGIFVAFRWLRFPDLTPDGSFTLGGAVFVLCVMSEVSPYVAVFAAIGAGSMAGMLTAAVNRFAAIPAVAAGLIVSAALYSTVWLILGRPNQFVNTSQLLIPFDSFSPQVAILTLSLCCAVAAGSWYVLLAFAQTKFGLRLRAIGENPLLAADLGTTMGHYTFLGLAIANGLAGLAGALFVQRSYAADVGSGIGMTVSGLTGMMLGAVLPARTMSGSLLNIVVGGCLLKGLLAIALELGMPPESFRLLTSALLVLAFAGLSSRTATLTKLRWN